MDLFVYSWPDLLNFFSKNFQNCLWILKWSILLLKNSQIIRYSTRTNSWSATNVLRRRGNTDACKWLVALRPIAPYAMLLTFCSFVLSLQRKSSNSSCNRQQWSFDFKYYHIFHVAQKYFNKIKSKTFLPLETFCTNELIHFQTNSYDNLTNHLKVKRIAQR